MSLLTDIRIYSTNGRLRKHKFKLIVIGISREQLANRHFLVESNLTNQRSIRFTFDPEWRYGFFPIMFDVQRMFCQEMIEPNFIL